MKRTGFNVPSHGELSKPWQWLLNCWSFKTVNQCDLILHKRRTFDSKQGDKRRVNRKAISIEPSSDQKHNNSMNNWNAQETIVLKIDYPTLILWSIVNFIFFMFYNWNNCEAFLSVFVFLNSELMQFSTRQCQTLSSAEISISLTHEE